MTDSVILHHPLRSRAWCEYLKTDILNLYDGYCRCELCLRFRRDFEPWFQEWLKRQPSTD